MKRPYYRTSESPSPSVPSQSDSLLLVRKYVLQKLLQATAFIGLIPWLVLLIRDIPLDRWRMVIAYSIPYLFVIMLALAKGLSYKIRAIGFLTTLFLVALVTTFTGSIIGLGLIWCLGLVVFSAILVSFPFSVFALTLSLATYLSIGGLISNRVLTPPLIIDLPAKLVFLDWVGASLAFFLLAGLVLVSSFYILRQFNSLVQSAWQSQGGSGLKEAGADADNPTSGLRNVDIRMALEVAHVILSVLTPDRVLQQAVDLIQERFGLYFVGVYLLDEKGKIATLKAGTGRAGLELINDGHHLPVAGTSLVGWSISHRQSRVADVTRDDSTSIKNPLLLQTSSEIALPLMCGDRVLGAMTIQSTQQNAFINDDVAIYQILADSLAIAFERSCLIAQEHALLDEKNIQEQQYLLDSWMAVAEEISHTGYVFSENADLVDENASGVHIPILLRGHQIGRLSLGLPVPKLQPDDQSFIEQVTYQAALAMENVRLLEETRRRAQHERLVVDIVKKARSSSDMDTILRTTIGELGKAIHADEGMILLETPQKSSGLHQEGTEA